MKEIVGNILKVKEVDDTPVIAICFTSNGVVRKDGRAVMGAGVAKLFRDTFKNLDMKYAATRGDERTNLTTDLGDWKLEDRILRVIAFPTKNDWKYKSTIELITLSAMRLRDIINKDPLLQKGFILLPRPGCNNGHLEWDEVKKVLEPILPENVAIITQDLSWKKDGK